jgi:hypothetical protein
MLDEKAEEDDDDDDDDDDDGMRLTAARALCENAKEWQNAILVGTMSNCRRRHNSKGTTSISSNGDDRCHMQEEEEEGRSSCPDSAAGLFWRCRCPSQVVAHRNGAGVRAGIVHDWVETRCS